MDMAAHFPEPDSIDSLIALLRFLIGNGSPAPGPRPARSERIAGSDTLQGLQSPARSARIAGSRLNAIGRQDPRELCGRPGAPPAPAPLPAGPPELQNLEILLFLLRLTFYCFIFTFFTFIATVQRFVVPGRPKPYYTKLWGAFWCQKLPKPYYSKLWGAFWCQKPPKPYYSKVWGGFWNQKSPQTLL